MADSYKTTIQVFNELASQNKPFSVEMVAEETIKRGGICRVGPCITIRDYFYEKEENGYLKHIGNGLYQPTKKTEAAFKACPAIIPNGVDAEMVQMLEDFQLLVTSKSEDEYAIRKILLTSARRKAGIA